MTLGVRLERELEDEFGGDFDEFGHGFGKKLGGEFGVDFDELGECGDAFVVCLLLWRCV